MDFNLNDVKPFLAEMLEKYALNTDMWKRDLNNLPDNQRQIVFTFDTAEKEKAVFKFKFIITELDFILPEKAKDKILELIASKNMQDL